MSGAVLIHDELLDHYKFSPHRKEVAGPDFFAQGFNRSCGDRIMIAGKLDGDVVTLCNFTGSGCVLSQAAASVLCSQVEGLTIDEIGDIDAEYMKELVGISLGPTRLKCVLLSLDALHTALHKIKNS
jgi:nitrogen fixation NifU-like protein